MTPTARTLQWLKKRGYIACVVEKWIPQTRQRKDAFGFGDILAFRPWLPSRCSDPIVVLIQCTSASNMASRLDKIRSLPIASDWINDTRRAVWLIGWGKRGERGKRKTWQARVVQVMPSGRVQTLWIEPAKGG